MTVDVRDHDDAVHEIEIPDGWIAVNVQSIVWGPREEPRIGDRYLDVNYLWINGGERWVDILTEADLYLTPRANDHPVFGCLIRKLPGAEVYQGANI
jgi:hypothetical protein